MLLDAWFLDVRFRRARVKQKVIHEATIRNVDTQPPGPKMFADADDTMKLGMQVTIRNTTNTPKDTFAISTTSSKFSNSTKYPMTQVTVPKKDKTMHDRVAIASVKKST